MVESHQLILPSNSALLTESAPCYDSSVPISDTTPEAEAMQLAIHRSMTGERRLILAFEMCDLGRKLNRARIRREHPEWSESQIARELLRLAFFPASLPDGLQ
jgi:Rv0078B-related antitoxin